MFAFINNRFWSAFSFGCKYGDGDYVEVPDNPTLHTADAFTVEAWININEHVDHAPVIWKGEMIGWGPNYTYRIATIPVDGLTWGACVEEIEGWFTTRGVVSDKGKWYHVAETADGTTVKAYVNGIEVGSRDVPAPYLVFEGEPVRIGMAQGLYGLLENLTYFNGLIDEVCIWNVARTQEEIQADMNQPIVNPELLINLVGYWNFDNSTADDLSQYDNDGILQDDATIVEAEIPTLIVVPTPYPTIQDGIDAANPGDIVLAADGTYTGDGNKNLDFNGKAITVTSANGAESTIIDCEGGGRAFYFHSGETEESVVNGFTITDGSVSGDEISDNCGGGIYCGEASPTITNNIITNNFAENSGGGIFCISESSAVIINNTITDNQANGNGGGGIGCWQALPMIVQNTITNNSTTANGGGILCFDNSSPTISNNMISNNSANWGGGIRCYRNGPSPIITNNTISGNSAIGGGGINCGWWNDDVPIGPSLIITNNIIYGNLAGSSGGINCENSALTIINNTIVNNSSGIRVSAGSSPTIFNVIVWENSKNEIDVDKESVINITYSDIQGGWEGEGNIDINPLFIDLTNGIYYLNDRSPCIGVGKSEGAPKEDIVGRERGTPPDIGAYENPLNNPLKVGDTSGDGSISAYDASLILQYVVGLIDEFPANILSVGSNITPRNRTISIPNLSVKANELISVPIVIDEANGLIAGGITIKYDTTVLKATGVKVTPDSLLNDTYWKSKVDNDEIRFAFSKEYLEEPNQSKILAILEFEVIRSVEGITTDLIIDHAQIAESLTISKVDGHIAFLPSKTLLLQNYPNPFNPDTWIPFKLSDSANVVISIYDVGGQLVRKIGLGDMSAGVYVSKDKALYWDGRNDIGEKVSSGVYFYNLQAGDYNATKRMLIVK